MKTFFSVIVLLLASASSSFADEDYINPIFGAWRTERPTEITPQAVTYGEAIFSEGKIWYSSICSYDRGPIVTAEVQAPVDFRENSFVITRSVQSRTNEYGYPCSAYLNAGFIEYVLREDGRLVLHNRRTGWRMVFVPSGL